MSTPEVLSGINWRDNEVTALTGEIADSYAKLGAALVAEVKPEDLRIGGCAVQDTLDGDSYTAIGWVPDSSVTLEHWSTKGDVTVRLAKEHRDGMQHAKLFARQVRGTGNWLPGVSDKRTAKIAQMAGASSFITVDLFDAGEPVDDAAFRAMRNAADGDANGEQGFRERLYFSKDWATPLSKGAILAGADWLAKSRYAWAYMRDPENADTPLEERIAESYKVQAAAEPTLDEYLEAGQPLVDEKVGELISFVTSLRVAVPIVRDGRRIRPTTPQHSVRVR